MQYRFTVPGDDFSKAGRASTELKRVLTRLGLESSLVRRIAVAFYEAEINMIIHAGGGVAEAEIGVEDIVMTMRDEGPGIRDLELAMTEGYSTAKDQWRELGFGAGMGLPNIKRNVDKLRIDSVPGGGTTVTMVVRFPARGAA
jgi:anti-sigma regulatory factor (Ser/Thr protein kinase)